MNNYQCIICKAKTETIGQFVKNFFQANSEERIHFCWPVQLCSRCGLIRIMGDFELFEKFHYAFATYRDPSMERNYYLQRRDYFLWIKRLIEQLEVTNKSIIDFGCAYGHLLEMCYDDDWKIAGVEVDSRLLEILKTKLPSAVIVDNLKQVPEAGTWGVCTMIDSLYYVEDPFKILSEIKKLLIPGGHIFIRITNRNWLIKLLSHFTNSLSSQIISSALTHFSKKSIDYLLQSAGYRDLFWIYREKGRTYQDFKIWFAYTIFSLFTNLTNGHCVLSPGIIVYAKNNP